MTDTKPREIFAWVADDLDGEEGIVMVPDSQGNPMPLATVKRRVALIGEGYLERHKAAVLRGVPIRLVRYVEAEVIREVIP